VSRIIIIGGVAAGMSAAAQAKRLNPDCEVVVFERGGDISYGACGLPYFIGAEGQKPGELVMLTKETALRKKGINVYTHAEVLKIHPPEKKITVMHSDESVTKDYFYDRLIIATGASPVVPDIEGIKGKNIFFLRSLEDGVKFKKYIYEKKPVSGIIIGEGHIGLEMAENLKAAGVKELTIICGREHLCWWLDADMALFIEQEAERRGIRLLKNTRVREIGREGDVITAVSENASIKADFVFVSRGMKPNSELAKAAGIKTGQRGSIDVNEKMETSEKDVYAAGDCANVYFITRKERIYMPRGTTANKQGRAAGANAAGGERVFKGVTGAMVFKFFDLEAGRVGMWEEEAARKKLDTVSVTVKSVTRAGYYPGGGRIYVKLTADKNSGALIGGQLAGPEGVPKRVDIISTAIYNNMSVQEFRNLDFAYAPPFGPVWDPLLVAANNLYKAL